MSTISYIKARGPVDDEEEADRDAYTTPPWLTKAIGPVWLDVCTNKFSTVQATIGFRLDRGQDALVLAKHVPKNPPGIVWCNPPYSRGLVIQFVRAFRHTRFAFLVRHDVSTEWFRELYAATSLLCTPWRRVNFVPPPGFTGAVSHNNPFPHSILYRNADDATDAIHRLCAVFTPTRRPSDVPAPPTRRSTINPLRRRKTTP